MNDELLMGLALFGGGTSGGGGGGGTTNYDALSNRPKINGVQLTGNKTSADLHIAEKMQDFFDKEANQDSTLADDMRIKMTKTGGGEAILGTDEGMSVSDGTNGFKVDADGTPTFTGTALMKWWNALENACVVTKEIPLSGWSANATPINGTNYYTNTVALTEVYEDHPDVNIDTYGTDVLPTAAQRSAFKLVAATGYFKVDRTAKTLIAYTQEKPTASFRVFIKGAK